MESLNESAPQETQPAGGVLSDAQKLHFRTSVQYIDKLLSSIEDILHAAESKSPFPKYKVDVNLAQVRVIEDYIRRFRTQLLSTLAWQNIAPPEPEIPATRAIGVNLTFIDITLADMRPSAMRGSGAIADGVASQLSGVVHELGSLTESMMNYVQRDLNQSLRDRINSLSPNESTRLIEDVEDIVTRNGLVEFRPRLDILLSRLENHSFEIAVFGRVSSGKSSFLNAILQSEVLPVGVNPITATPTRISFGDREEAFVRFGTAQPTSIPIEEFRALISERTNPGNERAVTRASVRIPASRLSEGIVFVDTPGLGSLARRGAAEAMAYLPSCDLALVLVDAASTLTDEDIATLRTLTEAGIPALVLLSKCDLLIKKDVDAATRYIEGQIADALQQTISVYPVSSISSQQSALEAFFTARLQPQIEKAESLKETSNTRKLTRLRSDVLAALQIRLNRLEKRASGFSESERRAVEARLREISGSVGELEETLQYHATALRGKATHLLTEVADQVIAHRSEQISTEPPHVGRLIDHAVAKEVAAIIALAQNVAGNAIEGTRKLGSELGRSDLPDHSEIDSVIRDAPQFDSAATGPPLLLGVWKLFGDGAARSRLRSSLREKYEAQLTAQLEAYAFALQQWAKSLGRALQRIVDSYLDVFRGILQNESSDPGEETSPQQLRDDVQKLRVQPSLAANIFAAQEESNCNVT